MPPPFPGAAPAPGAWVLSEHEREALAELAAFPLAEALFGRRSRRFARGGEIVDGPLAYKSRHAPLPLSELERLLLLVSVGGNTGWHDAITRHERTGGRPPSYSAAAGGRVFPSAAGAHTSEIFFTDDSGTYFFATRDAPALTTAAPGRAPDLGALLGAHRDRIRRLSDRRLHLPAHEPYMTGHNSWCANQPGSLLIIPVGDVAQQLLLSISMFAENGYVLYDDIHRRPIPGLERFHRLVRFDSPYVLSAVERLALNSVTSELSIAAYAGSLMQQAIGLGGWVFNGLDRLKLLGASGNPVVPGLGFRYDTDPRWSQPNATGLASVFEAFTPPHFATLRAAVDALATRKFGPGGPFHPDTPGPWSDSRAVRSATAPWSDEFRDLIATQAQYIYDTFGKFPGTVPTVQIMLTLQSHHLDLDFYDRFFSPGFYLSSHAEHQSHWHGQEPS